MASRAPGAVAPDTTLASGGNAALPRPMLSSAPSTCVLRCW